MNKHADMLPSELVYFAGAHFSHVVKWQEYLRLTRLAAMHKPRS